MRQHIQVVRQPSLIMMFAVQMHSKSAFLCIYQCCVLYLSSVMCLVQCSYDVVYALNVAMLLQLDLILSAIVKSGYMNTLIHVSFKAYVHSPFFNNLYSAQ